MSVSRFGVALRALAGTAVALVCQLPCAGTLHAAISQVATATGTTGSSGASSLSLSVPAGTVAGDVLIAQVAVRGTGNTITAPSGWTALLGDSKNSVRQNIYYRVAGSSEPASYAFTFGASERGGGALLSYRGVDNAAPVNVSSTKNNSSSTTVTSTAVTTDITDATLLALYSGAQVTSFTAPSGMTETYDVSTGAGPNGVTVSASSLALTVVGSTGAKNATLATAADNIAALVALKPAFIARLEYRFDECSYTGAAGEIKDSIGSSHGTPKNSVNGLAEGVIGSALELLKYSHWVSTSATLSRDWTLLTWFKTPFETSGSQYHILSAIAGGGDMMYVDHNAGYRWGVYTTSGTTDGSYKFGVLSDGWHHLALVGRGSRTSLYIDGALVDSVARKVNGGTLAYVGTSYDSVNTSGAQGWRAPLDEFVVGEGAATADEIALVYKLQANGYDLDGNPRKVTSCGAAQLSVTASASASTCTGHSVTITALDGSGSRATDYTGTVVLSTSSGRGGWAAGASSGSVTETGTANDGAATYTFRAADAGSVTLTLSNQSADDLTVTARDSTTSSITGTSSTVSFRDNSFVLSTTDALSTTAVAGRPHAMTATLYRRDTSLATPNCAVATNYSGAKSLKAWYTANASHPAGATAPAIDNGTALGTSVPGSANVSLTFTAGVASFNLTTSDVGKFSLNLRDDTRSFANAVNIDGSSSTITVRPFAFAITGIASGSTANPAGTATSGSKFAAAGSTFSATIKALLWQSADDANNDGTADAGANLVDNTAAARFAWPTGLAASSDAAYFTPASGTLGVLGGSTDIGSASYSGGSVTVSNLTYSEVGSIGLTASATGYLGTSGADVSGVAVNASTGIPTRVGRFYPSQFALVSSSLTPACSSGSFTYMDQPAFGLAYVLEARSSSGTVTTNYRSGSYTVGTVTLHAENADAGTDLGSRITGLPSASWTLGQYSISSTSATFSRAASADGPYDSLVLGVSVTDADGAKVASADMTASGTGSCGSSCVARALNSGGSTKVRFGRLKIGSALGAPQIDLPVPLTTEYWNGHGFVTNRDDACTRLTNTQFSFANFRSPLAACVTSGSPAGANGIVFSSGRATLRLGKPNVRGSVDLTANLGSSASGNTCSAGASSVATASSKPWLQGNWSAATYDRNPAARAVFGLYTNTPDVIFLRESY